MSSSPKLSLPRAVDRARRSVLEEIGERAARHFWRFEGFFDDLPSDDKDVASCRAFDVAVEVLEENEPLDGENPVSYAARINERLLQHGEEMFRDGAGSWFLGTIHDAIKMIANAANEWVEKLKAVQITHRYVNWAAGRFVYAEHDTWTSCDRIVLWRPGEPPRCLPVEGKIAALIADPSGEAAIVACGSTWLVDLRTGEQHDLGQGREGDVVVTACAYGRMIAGSESPRIDWISRPDGVVTSFEIERLETDVMDDVDLGVRAMMISADAAWLCLQDTGETRHGEMSIRSEPAKVRLYDLSSGLLTTHITNVPPLSTLVFSGDSRWVLAPGHRFAVPSLEASTDAPQFSRALALPGSSRFVIDDGRTLTIYDAASASFVGQIGNAAGSTDALCVAEAAEDRIVLVAVRRGAVEAWCVRNPHGSRPRAELDPGFLLGETRLANGIAGAIW